jgi:hypothetical protein
MLRHTQNWGQQEPSIVDFVRVVFSLHMKSPHASRKTPCITAMLETDFYFHLCENNGTVRWEGSHACC